MKLTLLLTLLRQHNGVERLQTQVTVQGVVDCHDIAWRMLWPCMAC